jgi:hypothetical protein
VCPKCKQKEEEMFQVVKEYLRKNPGAAMSIVSEETEVPVSLIESFLRQGRLEVTADSPIALTCEGCGTKIFTGRFCTKCHSGLVNELSGAAKQITDAHKLDAAHDGKTDKTEKMRFLKSDRIK